MKSSIMSARIAATIAVAVVLVAVVNARSLPPSPSQSALMARYIVNQAEWSSIATISVRKDSPGFPFVNLKSVSDGPKGKGNGVPYLFLTPLDFTGQDVQKDNRATMMMSLVQGNYCAEKGYDPMDPRCPRVIFSGRVHKIEKEDPEYAIAKNAIFERHEWLSHMPPNHNFYFAKFKIETIKVLAMFGGAAEVTPEEYFKVNLDDLQKF